MATEPSQEPTESQEPHMAPTGAEALSEVPELQDFIKQNLTPVLVGVGLAVAIFLGFTAYRNYKHTATETASSLLFNSQSVDQLQRIVDQYGTTPAAPLAMLSVAAKQYDEGQYELSQHVFAEFLQKYPDHDLKPIAELGQAQCLEATGRPEEGAAAYSKFLADHPDHYLSAMATFGKARCMEQMGKLQDAKAVYEDYLVANPTNDWSARAQSSLLFVKKKMRAKASGQEDQQQPVALEPITIPGSPQSAGQQPFAPQPSAP